MKTLRTPLKAAILLIILTFSAICRADQSLDQTQQNPQNENEPNKSQEKGPVYSPLKVKPYTKRTYRV